jgi:hypothetical protein
LADWVLVFLAGVWFMQQSQRMASKPAAYVCSNTAAACWFFTDACSPSLYHAGRMHFVKFETARIDDCLEFIEAKGLHRCTGKDGLRHEVRVKATGGGAVRFAGERRAVVHSKAPPPA